MSSRGVVFVFAVAGWLLLLTNGLAQGQGTNNKLHWVGSWAASQQAPETQNLLDAGRAILTA